MTRWVSLPEVLPKTLVVRIEGESMVARPARFLLTENPKVLLKPAYLPNSFILDLPPVTGPGRFFSQTSLLP